MLMTLLLALELTTRTLAKPSSINAREAIQLQDRIEQAENQLAELSNYLQSHRGLDRDLGNFTHQSARTELSAILAENTLLQSNLSQVRSQEKEIRKSALTATTEWSSRTPEVATLETQLQQLTAIESELTKLKNSQRVFYNQAKLGGRQVYLVELFESDILAAQANVEAVPERFPNPGAESSFLSWVAKQSSARIRFVIIVHPGTTEIFKSLVQQLKKKGFKIGYDLLPSDRMAIDAQKGAG